MQKKTAGLAPTVSIFASYRTPLRRSGLPAQDDLDQNDQLNQDGFRDQHDNFIVSK